MKEYNVNCVKPGTLEVNGKGNNLAWNEADVLTDFVSAWDSKTHSLIEFRALWDSKKLFFCFKVFDSEINIDKKDDSLESINNSDRVELFFRTNDTLTPYYCIEIDPTSRILDFKAYPKKNFKFDWSWPKNDIAIKSDIQDDYFTVEGAICIDSMLKLNLIHNHKIETGIFRAKYNKSENSRYEPTWISWVNPNTEFPDFHTPTAFGVLNLMEWQSN